MSIAQRGYDFANSGSTTVTYLEVSLATAGAQPGDFAMVVASDTTTSHTFTNNRSGWTASSKYTSASNGAYQAWHKILTATDISDDTVRITPSSSATMGLGVNVVYATSGTVALDSVSPNPAVLEDTNGDINISTAAIDPVASSYLFAMIAYTTSFAGTGPTGDPANWPGGSDTSTNGILPNAGTFYGTYNSNPTTASVSSSAMSFDSNAYGAAWTWALVEIPGGGTAAPWQQTPPGRRAPASLPQIRVPDRYGQRNPLGQVGGSVPSPTYAAPVPLNGTFETGIAYWESNVAFGIYEPATLTWDDARAHTGSHSLKVTCPSSWGGVTRLTWANHWGFDLPAQYGWVRIGAWVYMPTGLPDPCIDVAFQATSGPLTSVKDAWVHISFDYYAANTAQMFAGVMVDTPTLGTSYWVDDVTFELLEHAWPVAHAKRKAVTLPTEQDAVFQVGAPILVQLGLASETDTRFAPTHAKRKAVAQPAETDAGQAAGHAKRRGLTYPTETDAAAAHAHRKAKAVAQPSETDTAAAGTYRRAVGLGLASETDAAQTPSSAKDHLVALAWE